MNPDPSVPTETVKCATCHKPWRWDKNILSGEWLWFRPRGCRHATLLIDGELHLAEAP